jgi:hypothetical protein
MKFARTRGIVNFGDVDEIQGSISMVYAELAPESAAGNLINVTEIARAGSLHLLNFTWKTISGRYKMQRTL